MRIALTNFHSGWGGQALQVLQLARALRDHGHDVAVLTPPASDLARRAADAGLAVETVCRFPRGFRPLALWRDLRAMRAFLRRFRPDVVHCHGSQDTWITVLSARGRDAPPVVRTKHNTYPVRRHAANRWLYGRALAHTIAVAEPIAADLTAAGFAPGGRVSVIPAGLDDAFPGSAVRPREEVRAEWGIPAGAPLVGLVGRLAPDKGQDTLLYAAARLRKKRPAIRYVLIGTGGDWDRLRGLMQTLEVDDIVQWIGFTERVADATRALDVSVLAARACDASSTVVKEAMALGVPVVASDIGGTAAILEDGACGMLVRPGDPPHLAAAIRTVFDEPDAARRRAERARARVTRYLAGAVARSTEEVYTAVAAAREPEPAPAEAPV